MTKREKLRQVMRDLKCGWTLKYGSMATVCIGTCDRWGSPSYGKDYLYWNHYGSSANRVNLESLQWVLDVIFEVEDYLDYEKV